MSNFYVPNIVFSVALSRKYPGTVFSCVILGMLAHLSESTFLLCSVPHVGKGRREWVWEVKMKVTQSCTTLWDPMDYTVCVIIQARILEWVAVSFSRGFSQPRDWTQVSHIAGRFFTSRTTREAQEYWNG